MRMGEPTAAIHKPASGGAASTSVNTITNHASPQKSTRSGRPVISPIWLIVAGAVNIVLSLLTAALVVQHRWPTWAIFLAMLVTSISTIVLVLWGATFADVTALSGCKT